MGLFSQLNDCDDIDNNNISMLFVFLFLGFSSELLPTWLPTVLHLRVC